MLLLTPPMAALLLMPGSSLQRASPHPRLRSVSRCCSRARVPLLSEESDAQMAAQAVAWFDEVGNGVIVKPLEGFNGVGVAVLKDASAPGGREYEARIAERLEALERLRLRWRTGRGDGLDVVRGSRPWRFIAEERLRHFDDFDGGAVPADRSSSSSSCRRRRTVAVRHVGAGECVCACVCVWGKGGLVVVADGSLVWVYVFGGTDDGCAMRERDNIYTYIYNYTVRSAPEYYEYESVVCILYCTY